MQVRHFTQVTPEEVPGMPGVTVRWVISEGDGAPHFAMRVFEVPPGTSTEHHEHWWEHEVFVLSGSGCARSETGDEALQDGTVVFVPGGEKHQFVNDGDQVLRFICLVPHPGMEGLTPKAQA